jgi:hypothetical protein
MFNNCSLSMFCTLPKRIFKASTANFWICFEVNILFLKLLNDDNACFAISFTLLITN